MSITDELRERIDAVCRVSGWDCKRLIAIADRIDSEHEEALREAYTKGREDGIGVANKADMRAEYLRGRNDGWDEGYDAGFASADDWCAQHEDAMAEHGWVRKDKEHVISHATVEVTPHIDWSRMADELDEFAKTVRGMAGDAE